MEPEKANLLRIRENQRRSRARRKDHVQELETKLRQCELRGVEASSEIQIAARRVADENKRLRELLARNGITPDGADNPRGLDYSINGHVAHTGLQGEAVHALEDLLATRKCCTSRTPSTNTEGSCRAEERRSESTISLMEVPDARFENGATLSSSTTQSSSKSIVWPSGRPLQPHPHTPFNSNTEAVQPLDPSEHRFRSHQEHQHPCSPNSQIGNSSEYDAPPIAANSCISAVDLITTMAGGDPLIVREELGCLPGMDCQVDNALVFTVMDRYTDIGTVRV